MSKESIPQTECRLCARLDTCPIPSEGKDTRLCFTPIKREGLWKEEE